MKNSMRYKPPSSLHIVLLRFILIYILTISAAYYLASSVFPITTVKYKLFWFSLTHEAQFNKPLFNQILACILFVGLMHCYSIIKRVSLSTGNTVLAALLTLDMFCFIIGINIPLLHTTKFWIIKENLSLTQVLSNLKLMGEMQLFYIMLSFTFVIPVLKFVAISFNIFISKAKSRKNTVLSLLSKWAMLDVFVVGIIVSTIKSNNGIAESTTGTALTYFIVSILLSMIITSILPYTNNNYTIR